MTFKNSKHFFFRTLLGAVIVFNSVNGFCKDSLEIRFPVEKFKLPNGLTVLLNEDHSIPMISFHTWYKVGSKNEGPGVTGAAHMLEHMMFKGAKKYSGKDFDRILHENGVTNNAFTTNDYTGFYENLPSSKLELIMDMEVDRMRDLALKSDDLKSEHQVVAEERGWRTDNSPAGRLYELFMKEIFKGHSYEWPVIGWLSDIQNFTTEKLNHFFQSYYGPNNAVLVLSGDFNKEQAKSLIEKYYSSLPVKTVPERTVQQQTVPAITKYIKKEIPDQVQSPILLLGFQSPKSGHPEGYALDLLAEILSNGRSSRLHSKLVYQKSWAVNVGAYNQTMQESGVFTIQVSAHDNKNNSNIENLIWNQIQDIQKKGVAEKELQKAKNRIQNLFLDNLNTIDGKAQSLAINEILFGNYEHLFKDLIEYENVTLDQIQKAAQKYLNKNQAVSIWLVPNLKSIKK